jgi:hypothetical protein
MLGRSFLREEKGFTKQIVVFDNESLLPKIKKNRVYLSEVIFFIRYERFINTFVV